MLDVTTYYRQPTTDTNQNPGAFSMTFLHVPFVGWAMSAGALNSFGPEKSKNSIMLSAFWSRNVSHGFTPAGNFVGSTNVS